MVLTLHHCGSEATPSRLGDYTVMRPRTISSTKNYTLRSSRLQLPGSEAMTSQSQVCNSRRIITSLQQQNNNESATADRYEAYISRPRNKSVNTTVGNKCPQKINTLTTNVAMHRWFSDRMPPAHTGPGFDSESMH